MQKNKTTIKNLVEKYIAKTFYVMTSSDYLPLVEDGNVSLEKFVYLFGGDMFLLVGRKDIPLTYFDSIADLNYFSATVAPGNKQHFTTTKDILDKAYKDKKLKGYLGIRIPNNSSNDSDLELGHDALNLGHMEMFWMHKTYFMHAKNVTFEESP